MKSFFALMLVVLSGAAVANGQIQIVRDGAAVEAEPGKTFTAHVVSLVESCDVDTTQWAVHDGVWTELLESPDFVRLSLVPRRTIHTDGAGDIAADEIFLRLGVNSTPGHIYLKAGDRVRACAKYSPKALLTLAQEPALNLATARFWVDLAKALP